MNIDNFQNLIQAITKRNFIIKTSDTEIINGKEYCIQRILPITQRTVNFFWKAPLTEEKMLKSFITAFTTKYREPNPRAYDYSARIYGESARWENKSETEKEYAYSHHASNMFNKAELMQQVENNFNNKEIENSLLKYGFYNTEYGIGIFCFFQSNYVTNAINSMRAYLSNSNIPFTNEYSDAKWVLRFKLGISKEAHLQILKQFN